MNPPFADSLLHAYVARRARARGVESLAHWQPAEARRVLLVLTTGLGDAILSTPVLPALCKALPRADIRLLCRAAWAPLFDADPDLNRVIRYPGKYRRFFGLVRELRGFAPDITVILHGNDPDIVPLAFLAGSRFIVRIPTTGTRYAFLLSNREREADRSTIDGWHYIDNRLRVLDTLGIAPASRTPRIHLDAGLRERTAAKIRARAGTGRYWVLHAFAADPYKTWPAEKIRTLIAQARARHPDDAVVLTGSKADRDALVGLAAGAERVHVFAGDLDIAETAACLERAACVVAPDTGVLHLAAAVGVRVIGLYAATSATLVGPRGGESAIIQKPRTCDPCFEKKCPYTPRNCMDQIGVAEVWAALEPALAA
jgi:ADP-heptose:LPS heptosyltransferase